MDGPVRFSVIVVWRHAREAIDETLRTLSKQIESVAGRAELIVVTSLVEPATCAIAEEFPETRWLTLERPRLESTAWEVGLAQARGDVVAFAQAGCRYAPGWAEAALGAFMCDDQVAAGPVELERMRSLSALATYLCDYGALADPAGPRRPAAAACNIAFRSSALRARSHRGGLDKTALVSSGAFQVVWVPEMRAEACGALTYRADCAARFLRGRHFAAWRSARWPRPWRWAAGLGCLALPAILFARLVANSYVRERFTPALGLALPWIGASLALWSLGEMAGYVAGEGAPKALKFDLLIK